MRPHLALFLLLLAGACDRGVDSPPEADRQAEPAPPPSPPPSPPADAGNAEEAAEEGGDAAAVLRRYYDLIEAGDYESAWRMRGRGEEGAEAFARNFAAYERYRVSLGPATRPVESNGWLYVEVPIQITGRMKGGKPFGSVGSVTMRRPASAGTGAPPGWRIYTG